MTGRQMYPQRRVYVAPRGIRVVSVGVRPPRITTPSAGGGAVAYEHFQAAPASVWTINHNLGYFPDIHVYNVGSSEVLAEIVHVSVNQALVYLTVPMAGRARCV
jgi:hypothetical protein